MTTTFINNKLNICNNAICQVCDVDKPCPHQHTTFIKDAYKAIEPKYKLDELCIYTFIDIKLSKIDELINKIKTDITADQNDDNIIMTIKTWYDSITDNDKDGYQQIIIDGKVYSYPEYKIKEITDTLGDDFIKTIIPNNLIVDIGSGDCQLSFDLASKLNTFVAAVDIESAKEDMEWTSSANTKSKCDDITDNRKHIIYKGDNLVEAVKAEFPNNPVKIITYNHSLHHFGSIQNIAKSISQSFQLMSNGGMLFIREHDNRKVSGAYLNLQHLFLQLNALIKKDNIETILQKMHKFIYLYTSDFFTFDDIKKMCENIGYKFVRRIDRMSNVYFKNTEFDDISKTMYISFIKDVQTASKKKQIKKFSYRKYVKSNRTNRTKVHKKLTKRFTPLKI